MDVLGPRTGPQESFLACSADIAILAGGAGMGKSTALLLEPLHYVDRPEFTGALFRRALGADQAYSASLWHASLDLYGPAQGRALADYKAWIFPGGARIKIATLYSETDQQEWRDAELAFIGLDDLDRFSPETFWYLLERNRSTCGISPYLRATISQTGHGWSADLMDWWLDPDTGDPIPHRIGVLRWFVRVRGRLIWGDTASMVEQRANDEGLEGIEPISFTVIADSPWQVPTPSLARGGTAQA